MYIHDNKHPSSWHVVFFFMPFFARQHAPPTTNWWLTDDWLALTLSKKSPTGPTEWTRKKPEYPIALPSNLGLRWDSVPFHFWWTLRILHVANGAGVSVLCSLACFRVCIHHRSDTKKKRQFQVVANGLKKIWGWLIFDRMNTPYTLENYMLNPEIMEVAGWFRWVVFHFELGDFRFKFQPLIFRGSYGWGGGIFVSRKKVTKKTPWSLSSRGSWKINWKMNGWNL